MATYIKTWYNGLFGPYRPVQRPDSHKTGGDIEIIPTVQSKNDWGGLNQSKYDVVREILKLIKQAHLSSQLASLDWVIAVWPFHMILNCSITVRQQFLIFKIVYEIQLVSKINWAGLENDRLAWSGDQVSQWMKKERVGSNNSSQWITDPF